ncbi:MAG: type II toxin-antitoxin system Phd/YefM family antitoxin [Thermoanaerobaculia bacterium]
MTKVSASAVDPKTLDQVLKGGERVIIQDQGNDVAALVSIDDLRLIEQEEDRLDNQAAESVLREPGPNVSWEQIKKRLDSQ